MNTTHPGTPPERGRINPNQIKKLHALKNALKIAEDDYRLAIMEVHGFSGTCKDLTEAEADQLVEKWQAEAIAKGVWQKPGTGEWHGKQKHEDLGERDGFATAKQLRKIEAMWKEVSIYKDDQQARRKALKLFINRIAHVQELRFLTVKGAHQVITALISMKEAKGCNSAR